METARAKNILDSYVSRWNRVISEWRNPRKRPSLLDTDPFLRQFGDRLSLKLMPEPFWGRTSEASVVVANYNPAGYDEPDPRDPDDNGHYASWRWLVSERTGTYGDFAERLPVFGALPQEWRRFEKYKGRTEFWGSRIKWADRIVSGLHVNAGARRPVGMELCGWHSEHWEPDDTKTLLAMAGVEELVLKPFEAALTLSSARLGLCVGAGYERVLERMGFSCVGDWGQFPVYHEKGKNKGKLNARMYLLYRKGSILVLVTKGGQQKCPSPVFAPHETALLTGKERLLPIAARGTEMPRLGNPPPRKEKKLVSALENLKSVARRAFPDCRRGAADNVLVLCEDADAGWRLSVSVAPNGSDMKLEVHAMGREGKETLKQRVSTLSETTLPGAWKKCRIGGRGSLAVASFKVNAFDKTRPDFASMVSAGKRLLAVLQGGR